ncbi:hypothetical protein BH10ACI1_BH10ACI1_13630 [soil metagenome]
MKNIIRFVVSIALVFTFLFGSLPAVKACGPFTISPIFSLRRHADFPLTEYITGKTGIVPDSFGQMSLFVFYRQLNNLSLTKEEQKQIIGAMEHQIFYRRGIIDTTETDTSQTTTLPNYLENWLAARAKITGEKRDIETEKNNAESYSYFYNCLPDAFNNATKTLEARLAKYGKGDNVKEWLKGQDTVFSNCESAKTSPEILAESFPEWLRQDREYQIAATQFYIGDFAGARGKFERIAADDTSVWKNTAKFVVARTYIRQASFVKDGDNEAAISQAEKERTDLLRQAAEKLENILTNSSMNEFHKSAQRLLGLVKFRMIPVERQKELAGLLGLPTENQNIYNDLTDYAWLLSFSATKAEEKGTEFERLEAEKANKEYDYNYQLKLRDLPVEERTDELTDWILTYQAVDGFAHSFEKWKETGKLQWFVAAISKTDAKSAETTEILREADKIKSNSAAFATVRFHQVRLLLETDKRAEAKQKLDEIIVTNLKNLPLSTQNKFLAQRMVLSENLGDFLKFAQRKAALFDWDETGREEGTSLKDDPNLRAWETRTMFDEDSVAFLNEKVPLSVLRDAALSPQIPEHLKKFLVVAVWTRAFVLGNQAVEREFAPLMMRYAKELAPLFTKYAQNSNAANREADALIAVLRYPIIQPYVPVGFGREDSTPTTIDSIRGNWWCAEDESDNGYSSYDNYNFQYPKVYPTFLNAEQKATAEREHRQMLSFGNAATYLARRAVDFANKNPTHPQTPEILHLAVRSTRYGCTDENTGNFSKQAFDILHKRYKNSPWTIKTPYWFGQ